LGLPLTLPQREVTDERKPAKLSIPRVVLNSAAVGERQLFRAACPGRRPIEEGLTISPAPHPPQPIPDVEFSRQLIDQVHPPGWTNPRPAGRYNLVVLGAGTAGLVTAAIAAGLGARVALVEKGLMGGDCLNVGCVPSKALIRASRAWADLRRSHEFGVSVDPETVKYDFAAAMARMRRLRASLSPNDSARRFASLGVDVFLGEGKFTGPETIQVGVDSLIFSRAAICTGARAAAPDVPGIQEVGYLTNETVFNLTDLPPRLAVVGAGPIGCELAQAFARFGSRVTVIDRSGRILPRDDGDAARIVRDRMRGDGVQFLFDTRPVRVDRRPDGKAIVLEFRGTTSELVVDEILIGVGRAPNVEGLGLEVVGVDHGVKSGVEVNGRLQTTNPKIFAAGDVCTRYKFTHVADAHAQILVQNALFPHPLGLGYATTDRLVIPWSTYTDPELAHVGMTVKEAGDKGLAVESFTVKLDEVDRAVLDGQTDGFARVHLKKGSDRILGATVVAAHAGEMISELTALMTAGKGLGTLARTIHPYPTQAEVLKKLANAWRKESFTEGKKRLTRHLFSLMR
jgi:pyruvate/2-oxoglutarate dehydrogenase complex dihydrolipoamide dehydrogenase (E3) component